MRLNRFSVLAIAVLMFAGLASQAHAGAIQTVFVIAMENHNWTQPPSLTSPQQILGNLAAPYINSLVTPGNPNSQMVSYASNYLNVAPGVHPSEPNYLWAEAGSNLRSLQRQRSLRSRRLSSHDSRNPEQLSPDQGSKLALLSGGHRRQPEQQHSPAHQPVHSSSRQLLGKPSPAV